MNIIRNECIAIVAVVGLLSISYAAEQAPPTQEQVMYQVESLKKQVARSEGKVGAITDDMVVLYNEIESGVDEIMKLLESVRDSTDSKTRITMVKKHFIETLIKNIKFYQNRRLRHLENMRMGHGYLPIKEELESLKFLDKHIEKRIDQILKLDETLTKNREWSRYEKYQVTGYGSYKVSDDYTRYRKNLSKSDQMKGKVFDAVESDIEALDKEIKKIAEKTPLQIGRANESFWQERLGYYTEVKKKREQQIVELISSRPPAANTVDRRDAFDISKWVDDMVENLARDNRRLIQLSTQRKEELRYLKKWRDRLTQAEAYVEKTYGSGE